MPITPPPPTVSDPMTRPPKPWTRVIVWGHTYAGAWQATECPCPTAMQTCASAQAVLSRVRGGVRERGAGAEMHWKGGGGTPPSLQGAQPMPSHCPPDGKCRLQWRL